MEKVSVLRCISNCSVPYLEEQEEKSIGSPSSETWMESGIRYAQPLSASTTIRREIPFLRNTVMCSIGRYLFIKAADALCLLKNMFKNNNYKISNETFRKMMDTFC